MRTKGIITGIFIMGIVLIGVGCGIAFGEYSQFTYGGKQTCVLQEDTKEFTFKLDDNISEDEKKIYYYTVGCEDVKIIEDDEIKNDEICFEVSYNKELVEPKVEKSYSAANNYMYQTEESKEEINDEIYEVGFYYNNSYDDLELFMMCKDKLLKDLKNNKISDYSPRYLTGCIIKVAPDNYDKVIRY